MVRRILTLCLVAASASAQSPHKSFDLKGQRLGDTLTDGKRFGCGDTLQSDSLRFCFQIDSIGHVTVNMIRTYYHQRLMRIVVSFASGGMADIERAMVVAFGPASSRASEEFQTPAGVHHSGVVVRWALTPDTLTLRPFADRTTEFGRLEIADPALLREWRKYNERKNGMSPPTTAPTASSATSGSRLSPGAI